MGRWTPMLEYRFEKIVRRGWDKVAIHGELDLGKDDLLLSG